MSRTYRKKIRVGICTGSNTDYYRKRRRFERHRNRQELKNKLLKFYADELDDNLNFIKLKKRDSWDEPTDGSYLVDKDYLNHLLNRITDKYDLKYYLWLKKKFGKYLKHV